MEIRRVPLPTTVSWMGTVAIGISRKGVAWVVSCMNSFLFINYICWIFFINDFGIIVNFRPITSLINCLLNYS